MNTDKLELSGSLSINFRRIFAIMFIDVNIAVNETFISALSLITELQSSLAAYGIIEVTATVTSGIMVEHFNIIVQSLRRLVSHMW